MSIQFYRTILTKIFVIVVAPVGNSTKQGPSNCKQHIFYILYYFIGMIQIWITELKFLWKIIYNRILKWSHLLLLILTIAFSKEIYGLQFIALVR